MLPIGLKFKICWAFWGETNCPTLEYLHELQATDIDCFYSVVDAIEKIQDSVYLRPPTVKSLPIDKKVRDMMELRVESGKAKIFSRIAMIYTDKREVILLNGISKKSNKASQKFISQAVSLRSQIKKEEIEYEQIPIQDIRTSL